MPKRWFALAAAGVVVVAALVWVSVLALTKPVIDAQIRRQVAFVIFVPGGDYRVDRQNVHYDSGAGVLSLKATSATVTVTLNEQATPSVFNDVPDYYPKLVEKLNGYSSFDAAPGTVHLTKPAELKGQQNAVMNARGTLVFATPSHDLSDDDWRRFFNAFSASSN